MSIDNVADLTPRVQYTASAAQTAFPYPFPIFADEDLVVDVDGVTKALSTHYTVSGEGEDTGGNVTFLSAMAGGEIVTIYRDIAIQRLTDMQQNGPWTSASVNDEFDRLTLIDQQLDAKIGRAIRFQMTDAIGDSDIDLVAEDVANKVLMFDSDGKPYGGDASSLATVAAFGTANADVFTATAGQTVFTLSANPGAVANVDLSIDGATLIPTQDYTVTGTTLTLVNGGALVGQKVVARYMQGLPTGISNAAPYYAQTLAEIAVGVVPTEVNKVYAPLNALRYGAVGDGVTNNNTALANWIAVAKQMTTPKLVLPEGDFLISATLTFDLPNYSTVEWNGRIRCAAITTTAIRLGSSSTNTFGLTVMGGGVDIRRTTYDTAGTSLGCEVANLVWSTVKIRFVEGFSGGLYLNGTQANGGVSHCRFDVGYVHDNRYNIFLTASGSGYCNENSFFGGSLGFSSSWLAAAGNWNTTFNIYEDHFASSPLNNNKFFGPSLEAQSTTTVAASIYGQNTHFYGLRKEVSSGTQDDFKIILNTQTRSAVLIGGFGLDIGGITDNGTWNRYICANGESIQTNAGASGVSHKVRAAHNDEKGYQILDTGLSEVFSADAGGVVRAKKLRANAAATGESGYVTLGVSTQTTVGAAGAASALPATPSGYLRFFVGTTEYVLPYYLQA